MGSHRGGSYAVADDSLRRAKQNADAVAEKVRKHDLNRLQSRARSEGSLHGRTCEMRQHSFTFASDDLQALRNLVGGEWLYVAGDTLGPDFNTSVDVILGTTSGSVRVVSAIAGADFRYDEPMTYSVLSISNDVSGFEVAKRRGNVYVQHQREQIVDVQIVRETIVEVENGEDSWEYTTDIGIVFVLAKGAVAIAKGSHHTEMLVVRMASTVDELDIPDRTIEWADDLTIQHRSTRQLIPVDELT